MCVPICTHTQDCESGCILKLSLDSDWVFFNISHHKTLIPHFSISPTSYLALPATSLVVSMSTLSFFLSLCICLFACICIILISPEVLTKTFFKSFISYHFPPKQFACSSPPLSPLWSHFSHRQMTTENCFKDRNPKHTNHTKSMFCCKKKKEKEKGSWPFNSERKNNLLIIIHHVPLQICFHLALQKKC